MGAAIREAAYSRGNPAGASGTLCNGGNMSEEKQAAQGSAATAQRTKFDEMKPFQKVKHVCKIALCVLSFGFIYPHIMSE